MLIPSEILSQYKIEYDDDGFNIKAYEALSFSSSNSCSSIGNSDDDSNSQQSLQDGSSDGGQISSGNSLQIGKSFGDRASVDDSQIDVSQIDNDASQ